MLQEARLAYPEIRQSRLSSFEPLVDKFIDGLRVYTIQLEVRRAQPRNLEDAYETAVQELGVMLEQHRATGGGPRGGSIKTVAATTEVVDPAIGAMGQSPGRRGRGRGMVDEFLRLFITHKSVQ